jgi:hypothetical protein
MNMYIKNNSYLYTHLFAVKDGRNFIVKIKNGGLMVRQLLQLKNGVVRSPDPSLFIEIFSKFTLHTFTFLILTFFRILPFLISNDPFCSPINYLKLEIKIIEIGLSCEK